MAEQHPLFEELEAFDPNWQRNYNTLLEAVAAATVDPLVWLDWLGTEAGARYLGQHVLDAPHDYQADNEARAAQREAEVNMARRGQAQTRRGYVRGGDEV